MVDDFSSRFALAVLGVVLLAPMAAPSQIPDGHIIVSRLGCSIGCNTLGGLSVVHPVTGATQEIQGLPADLIGQGTGSLSGPNAVAYWEQSDAVVAATAVPTGQTVRIHVVFVRQTATGLSYDPTRSFDVPLGTAGAGRPGGGGVGSQIVWLSASTVAVTLDWIAGGPAFGIDIVVVDLAARQITNTVALAPKPPGVIEAFTHNPVTGEWILAFNDWPPGRGTTIVRAAPNGTISTPPLRVFPTTSWDTQVESLLFDPRTNTLVVPGGVPRKLLRFLDPQSGSPMGQLAVPEFFGDGLAFHRTTNGFVGLAKCCGINPTYTMYTVDSTGVAKLLAVQSGFASGTAIKETPNRYGAPSPMGGPAYRFELWPNPGGVPTLGNSAFAVRVANTTGPNAPGGWLVSADRGNLLLPALGVRLLLDLTTLVPGGAIPASGHLPLPIPNLAGLQGLKFRLQTYHPHGSTLAASEGLELRIL